MSNASDRRLASQRRDLVQPITKSMPLDECYALLKKAHKFLSDAASEKIAMALDIEVESFGSKVKRLEIELPMQKRPDLISSQIRNHNLMEVINQCATMERLIDALQVFKGKQTKKNSFKVELCHPTTSSSKSNGSKGGDHDLVLKDSRGFRYFFEVSDVIGEKDSNKKELKELVSLGAIAGTVKSPLYSRKWPAERLFLVCSSTFAKMIVAKKRRMEAFKGIFYKKFGELRLTAILEVKRKL